MDETQEARRKRLKAMQTSADEHEPSKQVPGGIQLPNPLADMGGVGPSTIFPSGTEPRQFPTQPPPPPPDNANWQHYQQPMSGFPNSFGHQHPPQYHNRGGGGGGGGGRQGGWDQRGGRQQQGRGSRGGGGGRHGGRGQFGGAPPGRGRGRQRRDDHGADIEAYISPEMVSNPWARLEASLGPPTAGNVRGAGGELESGRMSEEGAIDRPWH